MKNRPMPETAKTAPNVSSRSHLGECTPRLRFPGFYGKWNAIPIRDIGNIVTGSTPPTADKSNYGSDYPFCTPADVGDSRYVSNTNRYVSSKGFGLGRPIPPGGVIVTCIGIIGKVAIAAREMITNQQINAIIIDHKFDSEFIFDAITRISPTLKMRASQQTLPILSKAEFGKVEINIPGFVEQQKLGTFFSILASRMAMQRRLVELLKKHKRGLLREVFEECAEGDRRTFCEIASRRTEKISPSNDSTLDCIELEHIEPDTGLILGSVPLREQSSLKNRCRPNDIIFGKLRPYLRKFVFAESECAASSETWVLTAASGINPRFLFYLIQSEPFMRVANISSGTKMPRSEWLNVANAQFAIPSESRQQTIAECFTAIDVRIQDAQKTFLAMQAYKRGLLKQMFV